MPSPLVTEGWHDIFVTPHMTEPKISFVVGEARMIIASRADLYTFICQLTRAWNVIQRRKGERPIVGWDVPEKPTRTKGGQS